MAACSQTDSNKPAALQPYTIVSVLPTPVAPGAVVTAYGTFPKGTASLTLNDSAVPASAVQDGLSFTVPADGLAGTYTVSVPNAVGTPGSFEVRPRLDAIALNNQVLTLKGAGWGRAPLSSTVSVEVGNQNFPPELTADGLRVTLPGGALGNGAFTVRVRVGSSVSNARSFSHEAGHLSGKVLRPLEGQAGLKAQSLRVEEQYLSLLVASKTPVPAGASVTDLPSLKLVRFTFKSGDAAKTALTALRAKGISVQPDYPVHLDGSLAIQAAAPSPSAQWFWPLMGLPQAWKTTTGQGVTVAVVDTGVLLTHPAFQDRLWPGWNVVDSNTDPTDLAGHGTHVAGLIAASGDTAAGVSVTGAAPGAMLLPVKVLNDLNGGTVSDLAQGILWAVDDLPGHPNPHPAQIINLSLGTPEISDLLTDAVKRAQKKGALVVAAAGNDGGPLYFPAAYPGVLAVTSVSGPTLAYQPSYANHGAGIRVAAYGGDQGSDQDGNGVTDGILSTDRGVDGQPGYAYRQGTSMASPEVAGLAALALSAGTPPPLLKATLEGHATDLGYQGYDEQTGWGMANANPARVDAPRIYVVAQDAAGKVLNWTTAVDGHYTLTDLPPGVDVTVTAFGDGNNDGVLGEAGDLGSTPFHLTVGNASSGAQDLQLHLLDGTKSLTLGNQGE